MAVLRLVKKVLNILYGPFNRDLGDQSFTTPVRSYKVRRTFARHLRLGDFAPLGGLFPTEGMTAEETLRNVRYHRLEVYRWDSSMAILSDEISSLWATTRLMPINKILDSLETYATEATCRTIDEAFRESSRQLAPWDGSVVRSEDEDEGIGGHVASACILMPWSYSDWAFLTGRVRNTFQT